MPNWKKIDPAIVKEVAQEVAQREFDYDVLVAKTALERMVNEFSDGKGTYKYTVEEELARIFQCD